MASCFVFKLFADSAVRESEDYQNEKLYFFIGSIILGCN